MKKKKETEENSTRPRTKRIAPPRTDLDYCASDDFVFGGVN